MIEAAILPLMSQRGSVAAWDGNSGIYCDLDVDSPVLAIAFGGLLMRFGVIPPFEFLRIMSTAASVKKVFIRDHHRAWYHRGVLGLAADIEGTSLALRRLIDDVDPARVVLFGNSAGGYASLLFGRLLGVTEVHAFCPQTFISPELRARFEDQRWSQRWTELIQSGQYQPQYGDLAQLFARTSANGTRFVVHYLSGDELVSVHAQRLASRSSDVELRAYGAKNSNLVQHLRKTGELRQLLEQILSIDEHGPGDRRA